MVNFFTNLSPYIQALIATLFTWFVTIIGAMIVFLFKKINKNVMDAMLGFAAGIMLAASFFSLLNPSLNMAKSLNLNPWLVALIGFLSGGILLFIGDKLFSKFNKNENKTKRSLMLITSITLHNIPEGLAVGVAFGSLIYGIDNVTLTSACMLALGIGIQNFPEGTAVSLPLRREGFSRHKSFILGALSGIVEPISGVIGALLVMKVRILLPYLLAFASGAMIYVVVCELIPESQTNKRKDIITIFTLIGFAIMMVLDVALG